VKVAVVVQRYGADINGGAELHARYIAEHLASHVQVEVLTTCAKDYITWRNERPEGLETVNGIPVRRFPVSRERDPVEFGRWSDVVFQQVHSYRDELAWLEAEGPTSPALVEYIRAHADDYDFFIFFSVRYPHSFHGLRAVASKAVLVPTAERDGALGLGLFRPIFRGARALMYNSYEERALIQGVAGNTQVPGVVVGVGSEVPERSNAGRFRQKFGIRDRFAIYVGRIDQNKGCPELFEYFEHYSAALVDGMHLVLIGAPIIPIPKHPRIHHLGFVDDQDKFDAMAAAELLIMPSYFESLSMVALEAWAMGKPVLANAKCDVLQGQCLRSNAGLFYENFREFSEALRAIDGSPSLQAALGRNGRAFFDRHYTWPVIMKKYTDMLERLAKEPAPTAIEPLPGWLARRRRNLPPAESVVKGLPSGPYREPGAGNREPGAGSREPNRPQAPRPSSLQAPKPQASKPQAASPQAPSPQASRPSSPQAPRPDQRGPRNDRRGRPPRRGRRPQGGR
jgi:glycosyltransferase involved in cell wall biosynthesis